ncbi:hypothetical protein BLNAU_15053 [Blattamonas nauphoetae]|uniref:RRM domain-containing protein n=1 Tax=Blattamonas nauphoetae TaxID=2049346 RepID=A0ABQ9XBX2_9EUKA|nr:hypothetical protein BLNAU_15053 [Blattamonas nauphoetae]
MTDNKLFVGNLSNRTSADQLKAFIEKVAPVENCSIRTRLGRSLGFGFVDLKNAGDCQKVVDQLKNKSLNGREINIELYKERDPDAPKEPREKRERGPRPERRPRRDRNAERVVSKTSVKVSGIPAVAIQEDLGEAFKGYNVETVVLSSRVNSFTNSTYGFVHFKSEDDQKKAIAQSGKLNIGGNVVTIEAAYEL